MQQNIPPRPAPPIFPTRSAFYVGTDLNNLPLDEALLSHQGKVDQACKAALADHWVPSIQNLELSAGRLVTVVHCQQRLATEEELKAMQSAWDEAYGKKTVVPVTRPHILGPN